jgi:hypothetical protein
MQEQLIMDKGFSQHRGQSSCNPATGCPYLQNQFLLILLIFWVMIEFAKAGGKQAGTQSSFQLVSDANRVIL